MTAMKFRFVIGGFQIFIIVLAGQYQAGNEKCKKATARILSQQQPEGGERKKCGICIESYAMQYLPCPGINKSLGPKNTEWSHLTTRLKLSSEVHFCEI